MVTVSKVTSTTSTFITRRILNNNQNIFFIRSHHYFMLFRTYSQEGQIVLWVDVADGTSRFCRQLMYKTSILNSSRVVKCRADGNTFLIDNNNPNDTFVRTDTFDGFFNFRHFVKYFLISV